MVILWDWLNRAVRLDCSRHEKKKLESREFQGISEAKVGAHSEKANRWVRVPPEVPIATC